MRTRRKFPYHGWIGLILVLVFWAVNWIPAGVRTHWAFFPMWLGYCLTMDALVCCRRGSSLLTRNWRRYLGLFTVSAPVWWLFEVLNLRTQNWTYVGADQFSSLAYAFWTTLNFTTVIPAVFGSAEWIASFDFVKHLGRGPRIGRDRRTTTIFFMLGWMMLILLLLWPKFFFPFLWISLYFILEPLNIWLGHRSLPEWIEHGDWRPVVALWIGVLLTAFFWEMWNFLSFPKWVYQVPWVDWFHLFEMPLLGYGGYLPFALEMYAIYHFIMGLFGDKSADYLKLVEYD